MYAIRSNTDHLTALTRILNENLNKHHLLLLVWFESLSVKTKLLHFTPGITEAQFPHTAGPSPSIMIPMKVRLGYSSVEIEQERETHFTSERTEVPFWIAEVLEYGGPF